MKGKPEKDLKKEPDKTKLSKEPSKMYEFRRKRISHMRKT
jgi:hypothetical protein